MDRSPLPHLALYQPEIAGNLGAAIRTAACFGSRLHVIEPCGFPWKSREMERAAMDYAAQSPPVRHASWSAFRKALPGRLVLMTTKSDRPYWRHSFEPGDILLMGSESAGVTAAIHDAADVRLTIPMAPGARSLNVAIAAAVVLAEAQRQLSAV